MAELTLTDRDGDLLEIQETTDGFYFTVEQGGVLATVGPYARKVLADVL